MVPLKGEPRSPRSRIPGARRPPHCGFVHEGWQANGHYRGTNGGHWVLRKNASDASGTKYVSEKVQQQRKICLQKCVASIYQHLSYALYTSKKDNINNYAYKSSIWHAQSSKQYESSDKIPPIPHFYWQMLASTYVVPLKGEPRSPRSRIRGTRRPTHCGFVHQKPMSIIEAPMEAIGGCEKMFREPLGQHMCPK